MMGTGNEEASPYAFFSSLLSLSLLPKRSMQRIVLIIMNNVFFYCFVVEVADQGPSCSKDVRDQS